MRIGEHCAALAAESKVLSTQPATSRERATILAHIADSWTILAFLYEELSAVSEGERKRSAGAPHGSNESREARSSVSPRHAENGGRNL
jgi:hypothetical protein